MAFLESLAIAAAPSILGGVSSLFNSRRAEDRAEEANNENFQNSLYLNRKSREFAAQQSKKSYKRNRREREAAEEFATSERRASQRYNRNEAKRAAERQDQYQRGLITDMGMLAREGAEKSGFNPLTLLQGAPGVQPVQAGGNYMPVGPGGGSIPVSAPLTSPALVEQVSGPSVGSVVFDAAAEMIAQHNIAQEKAERERQKQTNNAASQIRPKQTPQGQTQLWEGYSIPTDIYNQGDGAIYDYINSDTFPMQLPNGQQIQVPRAWTSVLPRATEYGTFSAGMVEELLAEVGSNSLGTYAAPGTLDAILDYTEGVDRSLWQRAVDMFYGVDHERNSDVSEMVGQERAKEANEAMKNTRPQGRGDTSLRPQTILDKTTPTGRFIYYPKTPPLTRQGPY